MSGGLEDTEMECKLDYDDEKELEEVLNKVSVVLPRPRDSRFTSRARDRELKTLGVKRTVEVVAATLQRSTFLIKELILTHTCSLAYYKYFWRRVDRCIGPIFLVETKQEVQLIMVTSI
ncbi:hypothetical protein NDU88_009311 [Pleurodeles waltl]|uniref:Uncharacterized protein n=1 Tax=Pleurodeles waltl TaxID=8319 RepID=A0AAV7QVF9_PLEWA|nr:hypothetical protein NDU88_009311 [Pleurodeles waltl]